MFILEKKAWVYGATFCYNYGRATEHKYKNVRSSSCTAQYIKITMKMKVHENSKSE